MYQYCYKLNSCHTSMIDKTTEPCTHRILRVLCGVCGQITLPHSHYGAVVCDSCRIFFRRAVKNKNKWTCRTGKQDCIIAQEIRTNCKVCRFIKCLRYGMEPDLVDKVKKSVVDNHAGKNKNQGQVMEEHEANLKEGGNVDSQCFKQEMAIYSNQATLPGPSVIVHFTPEYSQEEQSYFSFLCHTWMNFSQGLWSNMSQSPECKQDMDYRCHIMRTGLDNFQRVDLYTFIHQGFGISLQKAVEAEMLNLLWTLAPEIDAEQKTAIIQTYQEYKKVVNIFHSHAAEHWSMEDVYSRLYWINVNSPAIKQFLPADIASLKLPNILKSPLFSSPWAENLELENFFLETAETLVSVVNSAPWNLLFTTLLIQSACKDVGSGLNSLFIQGHLKGLLFKTLVQTTKSPDSANRYFSRTFQLIEDIKKCSDIFNKITNMPGCNRIVEIDQIDVQQLP